LQKLREAGLIKKLQQDAMKYEPWTPEVAFKDILLVDVAPVFSILALGIVVAVCVVLIERQCKKFQNTSDGSIQNSFPSYNTQSPTHLTSSFQENDVK
jgi:hypothetical protein